MAVANEHEGNAMLADCSDVERVRVRVRWFAYIEHFGEADWQHFAGRHVEMTRGSSQTTKRAEIEGER